MERMNKYAVMSALDSAAAGAPYIGPYDERPAPGVSAERLRAARDALGGRDAVVVLLEDKASAAVGARVRACARVRAPVR